LFLGSTNAGKIPYQSISVIAIGNQNPMPEFFNVLPPDEARALLMQHLTAVLPGETIPTESALGRVTGTSLLAPHPLPAFRRSTMDGYAVRAADTYGASGSLPAFLSVTGEVPMGRKAGVELGPGQAVVVHTGGMIPQTADAVVQVELTQIIGADPDAQPPFEIEVFKAVASGENVLQVGEDVQPGAQILPQGHLLRPQDLGGLLALGIMSLVVTRRPHVAILATGDEVVPPQQEAGPGEIRDINSYTVAGQVSEAGGIPILAGIVSDDLHAWENRACFSTALPPGQANQPSSASCPANPSWGCPAIPYQRWFNLICLACLRFTGCKD
jgi:molybdopterin molybdotransferase